MICDIKGIEQKWMNQDMVAEKIVLGNPLKVGVAMLELVEINGGQIPGFIEYKNGKLCLRRDKFWWFCEKINVLPRKCWLNANDLAGKMINADFEKIFAMMYKLILENGGQIPGGIEYHENGGVRMLHLHSEKINWFCQKTGLKCMPILPQNIPNSNFRHSR
ncbi:MAG: hypothetical protein MJ187_04780 [Alphaproteobacteria bacterium]|nr:hypothetical protein [Alphaproteobacteria bacterium]